jgi:hypothetical protein
MLTNVIRQFLETKPFTPFTMSLTSRTTIRIARAETATVSESGEILHVIDVDDRESFIAIRHVVCIIPDASPDDPVVIK